MCQNDILKYLEDQRHNGKKGWVTRREIIEHLLDRGINLSSDNVSINLSKMVHGRAAMVECKDTRSKKNAEDFMTGHKISHYKVFRALACRKCDNLLYRSEIRHTDEEGLHWCEGCATALLGKNNNVSSDGSLPFEL